MKRTSLKIILMCFILLLFTTSLAYSQPSALKDIKQTFIPSNSQLEIAKNNVQKKYQNDTKDLRLVNSPSFILESANAKFEINPDNNMVRNITYKNVSSLGKKSKISEQEAHNRAINFIKGHYPEINLTKFEENSSLSGNYVLKLTEIDPITKAKLLNYINVIINAETGDVISASFDISNSSLSTTENTMSKTDVEIIANNKVKNEFDNAKLVSSSTTMETKLHNGTNILGWIFIYESDKHSAAIMVDAHTGQTFVQRAY